MVMEQKQSQFLQGLQKAKHQELGFVSYEPISKVVGEYDTTTLKLFGALQNAYNYFKQHLFNNSLSSVVLTLNRKYRSMGYYKPYAWCGASNEAIPEININPSILYLPLSEVMQTLVHEMCHHFQYVYGKPGSRGYHNKEFSRIMFSVGLMCSSTGMPGGKVTGRSMSDYAIEGGVFTQVFKAMSQECLLPFKPYEQKLLVIAPVVEEALSAVKDRNKAKYSCPSCGINAWGKPLLNLICGNCKTQLL